MRNLSGTLLKLFLILTVGYVVARVGFHYYVIDQLKEVTNKAAAYAVIEYETLDTDIDGSIDVNSITVTPLGSDQSVKIQRIHLMGPTLLQIVHDYLPLLGNGGLPSHGQMRMENISLPLAGMLSDQLDATLTEANGGSLDVCSVQGITSVAMARELNMTILRGDVNVSYQYDAKAQRLSGDLFFGIKGMQSVGFDFQFANVSPEMVSGAQPQIPSISSIAMQLQIDPAYGLLVSEYCAEKNAISIEDYHLLLADQFVRQQRGYGVKLGWGLKSTVKKFYQDWGKIELALKPASPINPLSLLMLRPEKLLDSLGMELTLNGQLITDLTLEIGEAKGRVSDLLIPPKKVVKPKKRRVVYRSVYRQVPLSDLSRYIDQVVIMYTKSGVERVGAMVSLDEDTARLDQRPPGGSLSSYVPLYDVERVEVLFRERVPQQSTTPEPKAK